jgi:hypothetical protein
MIIIQRTLIFQRRIAMARTKMIFLLTLCVAMASMVIAAQGTRMTDKEVKKLMETVEKDVELFTKAMDSQYRKATLRSASGEVEVEVYLKNLKDLAKKMKDGFDSKYPANDEVLTFLRYAEPIQARHARGDSLFGAEKEWPRLSGDIVRLSTEYNIRWESNPDTWNAIRINDKEVKPALESLQKSIGDFRKDLDKAAKKADVTDQERKKALDTVKRMEGAAKDIKKAFDKKTDASGALALLKTSIEETQSFISSKGVDYAVASSWGSVERSWGLVRSAFHLGEF